MKLPVVQELALDDCWNHIGVHGDRSCARLPGVIHCRNCPTYSRAAIALLDKLPAAEGPARQSAAVAADTGGELGGESGSEWGGNRLSCLVFRVGAQWLALPSLALSEVSAPCRVHSLPHRRRPAITGLAVVHGSLLVCVSLGHLIDPQAPSASASQEAPARGARMLILGQGRGAIALPVDEVAGVERIDPSALQPLPTTVSRASAHFTQAVLRSGERNVGLLDPERLQQAITRSLA